MNTCGQCKFAKPIPGNIMQRICMGGPPQVIVVPTRMPNGQTGAEVSTCFPNVETRGEAPGCFQAGIYGADFLEDRVANEQDDTQI